MSDPQSDFPVDILHIRSDSSRGEVAPAADAAMDARLADRGLRVECCGDVYRGLARMVGGAGRSGPRAVVVCVEVLGPAEFEFFTLVAQARRGVPVYVYGAKAGEKAVARAVRAGAAGAVNEDVLRDLAARVEPAPRDATSWVSRADETGSRIVPEKTECDVAVEETAHAQEFAEEALVADEEAESVAPARVPWLRYQDRPVRAGPGQHLADEPDEETPAPIRQPLAPRETARLSPHAPLLTEEELRALIGDDISALGPREAEDDARRKREREGGVL